MDLTDDMKGKIAKEVMPLVAGSIATMAVGAVAEVLMDMVAINIKSSTMAGDNSVHPTKDEAAINAVGVGAKKTEGTLKPDTLALSKGEVSANTTDAVASAGEATALESGAAAARTKAGAADIETKALKMT
jgi:hypothetical protein